MIHCPLHSVSSRPLDLGKNVTLWGSGRGEEQLRIREREGREVLNGIPTVQHLNRERNREIISTTVPELEKVEYAPGCRSADLLSVSRGGERANRRDTRWVRLRSGKKPTVQFIPFLFAWLRNFNKYLRFIIIWLISQEFFSVVLPRWRILRWSCGMSISVRLFKFSCHSHPSGDFSELLSCVPGPDPDDLMATGKTDPGVSESLVFLFSSQKTCE